MPNYISIEKGIEIRRLYAAGIKVSAIARRMGISRPTVYAYIRAERDPEPLPVKDRVLPGKSMVFYEFVKDRIIRGKRIGNTVKKISVREIFEELQVLNFLGHPPVCRRTIDRLGTLIYAELKEQREQQLRQMHPAFRVQAIQRAFGLTGGRNAS